MSNSEQIHTRFSASEVADYALVDFNGEKIWIYGSLENPALLIPHYEKTAAEMFREKMLVFRNDFYEVNGEGPHLYLSITPASLELSEVYLSFVRTILISIASESTIDSVIELVLRKYDEWATFFGSGNMGRNDTSRIIGAIGELLLLETYVEKSGSDALNNWWGPHMHRHDFEFEELALEVKATINIMSHEVEIHGLKQLLPDENRPLYLAFLKIQLDPKGRNIEELISQIIAKGAPAFQLFEKLNKSGINEELIHSARDFRFSDFNSRFFPVTIAFPTITPASLNQEAKSRISNVSYKISLEGLPSSQEDPQLV